MPDANIGKESGIGSATIGSCTGDLLPDVLCLTKVHNDGRRISWTSPTEEFEDGTHGALSNTDGARNHCSLCASEGSVVCTQSTLCDTPLQW